MLASIKTRLHDFGELHLIPVPEGYRLIEMLWAQTVELGVYQRSVRATLNMEEHMGAHERPQCHDRVVRE